MRMAADTRSPSLAMMLFCTKRSSMANAIAGSRRAAVRSPTLRLARTTISFSRSPSRAGERAQARAPGRSAAPGPSGRRSAPPETPPARRSPSLARAPDPAHCRAARTATWCRKSTAPTAAPPTAAAASVLARAGGHAGGVIAAAPREIRAQNHRRLLHLVHEPGDLLQFADRLLGGVHAGGHGIDLAGQEIRDPAGSPGLRDGLDFGFDPVQFHAHELGILRAPDRSSPAAAAARPRNPAANAECVRPRPPAPSASAPPPAAPGSRARRSSAGIASSPAAKPAAAETPTAAGRARPCRDRRRWAPACRARPAQSIASPGSARATARSARRCSGGNCATICCTRALARHLGLAAASPGELRVHRVAELGVRDQPRQIDQLGGSHQRHHGVRQRTQHRRAGRPQERQQIPAIQERPLQIHSGAGPLDVGGIAYRRSGHRSGSIGIGEASSFSIMSRISSAIAVELGFALHHARRTVGSGHFHLLQ